MTTPWFFEISRLIQETSPLAFSVVLFLYCLYNAQNREKWKLSDNFLIAISLALITYSYAAGRVLGCGGWASGVVPVFDGGLYVGCRIEHGRVVGCFGPFDGQAVIERGPGSP